MVGQYPSSVSKFRFKVGAFHGRTVLVLMALLLIAVLPAGCFKKEEKATAEKVVNVKAAAVERKSLKPFVEAVGSLKPNEEVTVSSEVDGILTALRVDEGSAVSRGMLLAQINDTDYRIEVGRAEAALRQAAATLENAKVEYGRKEALYKEALVTRQQFDDIVARQALAEGDVDRARSALDLARVRLAKTRIHSPLTGAVKEKKVTAGDYVRNGTPLLHVTQNHPVKLSFTVTERDVARLKIGQECSFRVDSYPDREFKGRLTVIYPNLEERTRTLQAEALVPNPDMLLKPGLFARVTLFTGPAEDKVVVPVTALLYENNRIKIFIVADDKAKELFVRVGGKYGEMIEIVEGLKGGENLVAVGQNNLAEGVKVNVAR
jgi:membrane fusion protein (multidrug efflux system)